jgi:hypothetical protein
VIAEYSGQEISPERKNFQIFFSPRLPRITAIQDTETIPSGRSRSLIEQVALGFAHPEIPCFKAASASL